MRPDAAPGRGIADHQVVEAGVGNERETPEKSIGGIRMS